ncbi:MAG: DinB family protein [bacterium]
MQDLLDDFQRTLEVDGERLLGISEEQSATARAAGKWSPKQIIGHLIDSAANNHQRFVRAQLSDELAFSGYQQEEWVRVQGYDSEPWQQLVQLWKSYNLHLLHVMSLSSEEARTKPRVKHNLDEIGWNTVSKTEPVTLEYFMRDYVAHMKNHLRQILDSR